MPNSGMVVIEPAPSDQRQLDGGRVQFTSKIEKIDTNLRLAWLPVGEEARSRLFEGLDSSDLPDLRKVEPAVKHPQARRVLKALIAMSDRPGERDAARLSGYSTLREPYNLMRAGFSPDEAFGLCVPGRDGWRRREQQAHYNHVREIATTGWLFPASVIDHRTYFSNAPDARVTRWQPEDRKIAAAWAAAVPGEPATPAARLARAYLAMLATDRPTDAQAGAFMDAARAAGDDKQLTIALLLVNEFPGDPRPFRPLVDEALARPKPPGDNQRDNNLYAAKINAANKIDRYKPPAPATVTELMRQGKQALEAATRAAAPTSQPGR
jgi:hypothetical protein